MYPPRWALTISMGRASERFDGTRNALDLVCDTLLRLHLSDNVSETTHKAISQPGSPVLWYEQTVRFARVRSA